MGGSGEERCPYAAHLGALTTSSSSRHRETPD